MNRKQELLMDFSTPVWSFRTFVAGRDMRPAVIFASFFVGGHDNGYLFCRMPEIHGLGVRPYRAFWRKLMASIPELIHQDGHFIGWRGGDEYFFESSLYVPLHATGEIRIAKDLVSLARYTMTVAGFSEVDANSVSARIDSYKAELRRKAFMGDE